MRSRKHVLLVTLIAAAQIEAAVVALNGRGVFAQPRVPQPAARVLGVQVTPSPAPTAAPSPRALPAERPRPVARAASAPAAVQQIGFIEIPKIGLTHAIFEGFTLREIDHGPGHYEQSVLPGEAGNTVFAGHRVTHSHPFLDIDRLEPGDKVIFHTATGVFTYEVTDHVIVSPKDTWILRGTTEPTFTIFGCHPKHSAKQRYVVRGRLVTA